jgi:hypothetical protein
MYKEFIPPWHTVNGNFHCDVIIWVKENVKLSGANNSWALPYDNAPPHMPLLVW